MSPYRSAPLVVETHEIGSRRAFRLQVALGVALLLAPAILVVIWLQVGGGVSGAILGPVVFGVVVLARARYSTIVVSQTEREVRVTIGRLGPVIRSRIPFEELESVFVLPSEMRSGNPAYELQLGRAHGEPVLLLRADSALALEPERARLGEFLLRTGAMSATRARADAPRGSPSLASYDRRLDEERSQDELEGSIREEHARRNR